MTPDAEDPVVAAEAEEPGAGVVGPLERGLAVVRAMSAPSAWRVRPSDLARSTGLARSTVDRVIGTLAQLGHVRQVGRDVELTPRLMELGNAYLAADGIGDILRGFVERLADEFDESVSIVVPDGDGIRFVTQVTRRRTMALAFRIGDLLPVERCAAGAVFATEWREQQWSAWRTRRQADPLDAGFPAVPQRTGLLDRAHGEADFERRVAEAAEHGWSVDDQLIEPGLIAAAVPLRGADGLPVCAVSVVSHLSRHSAESLAAAVLPRLQAQAPAMEKALAEQRRPGEVHRRTDSSRAVKEELGAGFLQSLARGLAVLASLGEAPGGLTLSESAEATGLARATARRALLSLVKLGYVEANGQQFRPLPRVLELGYAKLSGLGFAEILRPHLEDLVARADETASVAVLDGEDIRHVVRVPTARIMSFSLSVGTRVPAYATSMGRILLADMPPQHRADRLACAELRPLTRYTVTDPAALAEVLERTAAQGYALVDQELELGVRSLAVPIRDTTGRTVAALKLATHAGLRTPQETVTELLPALREAASRIEADLRIVSEHAPLPR
ncbi:IclR family transcriptional regulator C-terminal domain-containing protein [Streptomyces cacaoi]